MGGGSYQEDYRKPETHVDMTYVVEGSRVPMGAEVAWGLLKDQDLCDYIERWRRTTVRTIVRGDHL